jgi:hypothetical protein
VSRRRNKGKPTKPFAGKHRQARVKRFGARHPDTRPHGDTEALRAALSGKPRPPGAPHG